MFPLQTLQIFSENEIHALVCGTSQAWTVEELVESTKCDHGYSSTSRAITWLFEILSKMDTEGQRGFLRFATGTPHLPVGGLNSLTPKLTIVRRDPDPHLVGVTPDGYLPSVMTCANYLKLPDYSSKEIMEQRIRYACSEGISSFHLS